MSVAREKPRNSVDRHHDSLRRGTLVRLGIGASAAAMTLLSVAGCSADEVHERPMPASSSTYDNSVSGSVPKTSVNEHDVIEVDPMESIEMVTLAPEQIEQINRVARERATMMLKKMENASSTGQETVNKDRLDVSTREAREVIGEEYDSINQNTAVSVQLIDGPSKRIIVSEYEYSFCLKEVNGTNVVIKRCDTPGMTGSDREIEFLVDDSELPELNPEALTDFIAEGDISFKSARITSTFSGDVGSGGGLNENEYYLNGRVIMHEGDKVYSQGGGSEEDIMRELATTLNAI